MTASRGYFWSHTPIRTSEKTEAMTLPPGQWNAGGPSFPQAAEHSAVIRQLSERAKGYRRKAQYFSQRNRPDLAEFFERKARETIERAYSFAALHRRR